MTWRSMRCARGMWRPIMGWEYMLEWIAAARTEPQAIQELDVEF